MNTSFTPGPWVYYTNPITNRSVVAFDADSPSITKQLSEADARLIAAAPALFGALDWFIQFCDEHPEWTENELCNGHDNSAEAFWLQDARAAINLATGQEP